jgi:hypothetical protein
MTRVLRQVISLIAGILLTCGVLAQEGHRDPLVGKGGDSSR